MSAANANAAPSPSPVTTGRTGMDRALWLTASVVIIGTFMSILDTTIVNVAINTLAKDFNTSLSTIQWVSTGYMLALATVIPLTGWAADRFGTKRLYIVSISLFLVGSALSGMAWSAGSLIGFRVLQGLGGGMIMPAGMTILTQAAGPQRVGRVMGMVGVPMLLGPILGPILGGWLVDDVSWRWIFYVNIPIGIVALVMAFRILPKDVPQRHQILDWQGLALLSPGLALVVFGLGETATDGGFTAPQTYVPMIAGVLLVLAFIRHALRSDHPLIELRLFKNRTFSAAAMTTFMFGAAFFGSMLLIPLYYQVVRGQSALHAGLLLAPQGLGAMIAMPLAGRMTDRTGAGRIVLVGLGLVLVGMLSFTQVSADSSYLLLGFSQFTLGLGMGATMMPAMSAAYQTLTHNEVPRATSTINIIQRVGGAIGATMLSVILSHQLASHIPGATASSGLAAAQRIGTSASPAVRETLVGQVAASFGATFWWSVGLVLLALIPALFLPRRLPPPPVDILTGEPDEEPVAVGAAV